MTINYLSLHGRALLSADGATLVALVDNAVVLSKEAESLFSAARISFL